ncbi:MAG: hypothetical protein HY716_15065 [Planctomycetes bacterium]|nr:hypothetical protein [Planctomycetota bacterium]
MLVALVIFLVVVAASYALFESGRGLAARGEYAARRDQAARAALRVLEADLRGAYGLTTPYDTGFKGMRGGSQDAMADTLEFIAFNHHPTAPGECDMTRVAYKVDADPATPESGLVRARARRIADSAGLGGGREEVEEIAPEVSGLRIRYYDGSAWQDSWDSTVSQTLPKAVEVTVQVRSVWRDQEEIENFSTRLWLPVAATTSPREP